MSMGYPSYPTTQQPRQPTQTQQGLQPTNRQPGPSLTGDLSHMPPAYNNSGNYNQTAGMYQQAGGQQQQYFQMLSGLQNQLTQGLQNDPGAALYQQLLGMYDPNLGQSQHQQMMQMYQPVNQQSTGNYLYGY